MLKNKHEINHKKNLPPKIYKFSLKSNLRKNGLLREINLK